MSKKIIATAPSYLNRVCISGPMVVPHYDVTPNHLTYLEQVKHEAMIKRNKKKLLRGKISS
jgi:hypothetical protein